MNEIGSEFWTGCTPVSGEHDYSMRLSIIYDSCRYKVVETLSGRTALEHIVEILVGLGKTIVYLPAYCCHTMIEPFLSHGMQVKFYNVVYTTDGLHRVVNENEVYDAILLMDYFGHTDVETLNIAQQAKQDEKIVIYDATHSMYSHVDYSPYDFIYGSYRKWVDINCGFMAWKKELANYEISQNRDKNRYADMRKQFFDLKSAFMSGGAVNKDDFLPLVNEAETILELEYHHQMPDERSKVILRTTDEGYIISKRRSNARVLTEAINEINDERVQCVSPLLNTFDTSLFVPVLVSPNIRDELRRYLINKEIYCPVHWPQTDQHDVEAARRLFEEELSLICDQRYDEHDMIRIVDSITKYLNIN